MSYKSLLQGCNFDLQSILDQVNALEPNAGGNAGGSVNTCTVTIDGNSWTTIYEVSCSILDATGKVVTVTETIDDGSITLSNVVCGSVVLVWFESMVTNYSITTNNMTVLASDICSGDSADYYIMMITAPTTVNSSGVLTVTACAPL